MCTLMNIIIVGGTILGILFLQINPIETFAPTVSRVITQTAGLPMMIKNFGLCIATSEMFPPIDTTTRDGRRLDRIRRDIERLKHCSIWNVIVCGPVNHLRVCYNLMMLLTENPFLVKDVASSPFRCAFKIMCLFKVNLPFTRCDNFLGRHSLKPPILPIFSGQLAPWPGLPQIPNQPGGPYMPREPQSPFGPPNGFAPDSPPFPEMPPQWPPNNFVPGSPQFPSMNPSGPIEYANNSLQPNGLNDRDPFEMNAPPFGPNNNPYYSAMQNNPVQPSALYDEDLPQNRTLYPSDPTELNSPPFESFGPSNFPRDLYTPFNEESAKPPSILQQQSPYQPPIPTNNKQETTYSQPQMNSVGELEFSLAKGLYFGSENPKSNNPDGSAPYQPPIPTNSKQKMNSVGELEFSLAKGLYFGSENPKSNNPDDSAPYQPPIPGNYGSPSSEPEKSPSIPKEPPIDQPPIPDWNKLKIMDSQPKRDSPDPLQPTPNQPPLPGGDGQSKTESFGGMELSFDKNSYLGIDTEKIDRFDGLTSINR
ncbi:leucine-rich repeat extensin-like protein 5 [Harmonia axyridis]|uniref:leucine-rich repeat extensin-like protein 5 n=1 Tax=Harmonia axyridis TaxID=115357 RepID=UPI001E275FF9|nr:leucine-rich repeat extensin-like protein 5 [Harmonia axyridis]